MSEQSKALALPPAGKVLDLLGLGASVAALIDPSGTAGIASATIPVARAVLSRLEEADTNRRQERARLLIENLRRRIELLERTEDPPVDLFAELLQSAINQDDARKVSLQGAVIAWVGGKRPDPALARLAMAAVAELGFPELRAFISWHRRHEGRLKLERGWSEALTWSRLHNAGLISQTGTIMRENVTEIGHVLVDGCPELAYSDQEAATLR
ncbi:MAG: hypothetical protein AABZ53_11775 [Planctomycetota bacterium]